MPVVEFLVRRGANVNHANSTGNTALHFAMSFDTSGQMGEFLINNGADDSIENKEGLSPCEQKKEKKKKRLIAGRRPWLDTLCTTTSTHI